MHMACLRARWSFLLLAGLSSAACNDVLGIGEPVPAGEGGTTSTSTTSAGGQTSAGGGGAGGSTGGATTGGTGGAGGTTLTTTPCNEKTISFVTKQDASIFPGACNGAIASGNSPFTNVGLGPGIFRFVLTEAAKVLFDNDQVTGLDITLSRAPTCGDATPCTVKAPGIFEARPMRNDWEEGDGSNYSGVDYCRRLPGNPAPQWDMQGASAPTDMGDPSGTTTIIDADETMTIPMDPAVHKPWIGANLNLSVRVWHTDNTAVFVAVTHEAMDLNTAPRLTIHYCE